MDDLNFFIDVILLIIETFFFFSLSLLIRLNQRGGAVRLGINEMA